MRSHRLRSIRAFPQMRAQRRHVRPPTFIISSLHLSRRVSRSIHWDLFTSFIITGYNTAAAARRTLLGMYVQVCTYLCNRYCTYLQILVGFVRISRQKPVGSRVLLCNSFTKITRATKKSRHTSHARRILLLLLRDF